MATSTTLISSPDYTGPTRTEFQEATLPPFSGRSNRPQLTALEIGKSAENGLRMPDFKGSSNARDPSNWTQSLQTAGAKREKSGRKKNLEKFLSLKYLVLATKDREETRECVCEMTNRSHSLVERKFGGLGENAGLTTSMRAYAGQGPARRRRDPMGDRNGP